MSEEPYKNREIDEMFRDIDEKLDRIEAQTTATNGKVKKMIIAIVLIFGILMGYGVKNIPFLLSLLV